MCQQCLQLARGVITLGLLGDPNGQGGLRRKSRALYGLLPSPLTLEKVLQHQVQTALEKLLSVEGGPIS